MILTRPQRVVRFAEDRWVGFGVHGHEREREVSSVGAEVYKEIHLAKEYFFVDKYLPCSC